MQTFRDAVFAPAPQFTISALFADAELAVSNVGALMAFVLHDKTEKDARDSVKLLEKPVSETSLGESLRCLYAYAFGGIWTPSLHLTEGGYDHLDVLVDMTGREDMAFQEDKAVLIHRLKAIVKARAAIDIAAVPAEITPIFDYPGTDPLGYEGLALLSNLSIVTLRNRVSSKRFPVKTVKYGREIGFEPKQALDWLVSRGEFVPTRMLSANEFTKRETAYTEAWLDGGKKVLGGA
ncbi:hypothetical protein [Nevskia ramosa]|uniref:hypothetical protein n=1 Tax=Nevskia ramosa TaxID=64002 RepID=UPI003D0CD91F